MKLEYDTKWNHLNITQERSFDYIENVEEEQGKAFIKWFDTYMCKPKYKKIDYNISMPHGLIKVNTYKIIGTDYVIHRVGNFWKIIYYPTGFAVSMAPLQKTRQKAINNWVLQFYKIFVNPEITHKCKIINQ